MRGEYYIAYIDEDNLECHYMVHARTPEQALRIFLIRHNQYRPMRIIEWIKNDLKSKQKIHKVGDMMIEMIDVNKWYDDGQKDRDRDMKETREWIEENYVSSCCGDKIIDGRCADCGEHCRAVALRR